MLGSARFALILFAGSLCSLTGCAHGTRQSDCGFPQAKVETLEENWPNGKLRLRRHVQRNPDGTLVDHGTCTQWYDSGQKKYEAVFVRGKIHGVETQWHENGRKRVEQHYDHGLPHGPRYSWDEEGRKRKEEQYEKGKPAGTWTIWKKDGSIKWQRRYNRDTAGP